MLILSYITRTIYTLWCICTIFLKFWFVRHFNVNKMGFYFLKCIYICLYMGHIIKLHLEKLKFNLPIIGLFEGEYFLPYGFKI